jgi:hypothetical protein
MSSPLPDLLPDELPGPIKVGSWVRRPLNMNLLNKANLLPDELPGPIKVGDWVRLRKPEEIYATNDRFFVRFPATGWAAKGFSASPWKVMRVFADGDIGVSDISNDGYASPSALVKVAPPAPDEAAVPDQSARIAELEAEIKRLRRGLRAIKGLARHLDDTTEKIIEASLQILPGND